MYNKQVKKIYKPTFFLNLLSYNLPQRWLIIIIEYLISLLDFPKIKDYYINIIIIVLV